MQAEQAWLGNNGYCFCSKQQPALVHNPYAFQAYEEVPPVFVPSWSSPSSPPSGSPTLASPTPTPERSMSSDPLWPHDVALQCEDQIGSSPLEDSAKEQLAVPFNNSCSGQPHSLSGQQPPTTTVSKKAAQWRRYGTKVSPQEALRQLQAFTFVQPVPPATLPVVWVGPPQRIHSPAVSPGHNSPIRLSPAPQVC
eukprot:GGOE01021719.1.p1 GENE.GGOE01021719.1~~GGOE01021719.1.p1  ORF type:complete len:206 (-),score=32.87 GGOE01021719.1:401-985(-)